MRKLITTLAIGGALIAPLAAEAQTLATEGFVRSAYSNLATAGSGVIDTRITQSVATGGTVAAAINAAIANVNSDVSAVSGRVDTLEGRVDGIDTRIDNIVGAGLEGATQQITEALNVERGRITTLEGQVGTGTVDSRIATALDTANTYTDGRVDTTNTEVGRIAGIVDNTTTGVAALNTAVGQIQGDLATLGNVGDIAAGVAQVQGALDNISALQTGKADTNLGNIALGAGVANRVMLINATGTGFTMASITADTFTP
ncbi:MAG: hypothetical protein FWD15_03145 [Alphaproteobacteria bacterium]|nr:hypothetical protein [Alphaproteobacteria bacterium]